MRITKIELNCRDFCVIVHIQCNLHILIIGIHLRRNRNTIRFVSASRHRYIECPICRVVAANLHVGREISFHLAIVSNIQHSRLILFYNHRKLILHRKAYLVEHHLVDTQRCVTVVVYSKRLHNSLSNRRTSHVESVVA